MASREFHEHQERAAAQRMPEMSLEETRARIDQAAAAAPLADGVRSESVTAGSVPALGLRRDGDEADPVLCYFHGGGYRMGSALGWRAYGSHLAVACQARVLLVDYRLAPENRFPAAVDDALAAYQWLLESGEAPGRIVLAGDSAGGGLAAAALVAIRARDLPLPAGAVCLSPWADLTNQGTTYETRADADRLFSRKRAEEAAELYLKGSDPRDPLASPVFADWTGMPPLLIHVGDAEVLLDDARTLAANAQAAGVRVQLDVYPEMPHVWHLSYPAYPEAVQAVEQVAAFVRERTQPPP